MFCLTVRDHIMIAHSFRVRCSARRSACMGRLRGRSGAAAPDLDADGIVADIGLLSQLLKSVLEPLNYRNLDELPELAGRNTTTEVLAREICHRVRDRIQEGALGEEAKTSLASLKVTLASPTSPGRATKPSSTRHDAAAFRRAGPN